jgi:hypothetical protein
VTSSLACPSRILLILMIGILVGTSGCDGPNHTPPAVADSTAAKVALETALGAWKQGVSADELASNTPPLVVADEDWLAGAQLIDFQLLTGEQTSGVSIRWPVRLTLASSGKNRTVEATYVIATSPAIHIARAD